jgi:hypothetical protein
MELDHSVAFGDTDRAEDFDLDTWSVQRYHARAIDQKHEGQGGPIQDRHFRAIQFDQGVVHTEGTQGSHEMLDGADPYLGMVRVHQCGRQARFADVIETSRDIGPEVRATKDDTMVGSGGPERKVDALTAVNSDTHTRNRRLQRLLKG